VKVWDVPVVSVENIQKQKQVKTKIFQLLFDGRHWNLLKGIFDTPQGSDGNPIDSLTNRRLRHGRHQSIAG
jgi:hypothetical protein